MKKLIATSKFRNYYITDQGEILTISKDNPADIKVKALHTNHNGYQVSTIKGKTYRLHRLVAEAFIPQIESADHVDHIDENKLNNKVGNLQWIDLKANTIKSKHQMRCGNTPVPVTVNDVEFPSTKSAARFIYEDSGRASVDSISREIRRYLAGSRPAWEMYGKYWIE